MKSRISSLSKICGLVLFLFSMSVEVFADSTDSLCVTVEKAGKLKKQLKEVNPTSINTLKIIGAINAKDMLELAPFANIEKLYLDDAVYEIKNTNDADRTVDFSSFKNLKTLYSFPKARLKKEEKYYRIIYDDLSSISLEILAVGDNSDIRYYKSKKLIIYPLSDVITEKGYFGAKADELFVYEESLKKESNIFCEYYDIPLIHIKSNQGTYYFINKWKDHFSPSILHGDYGFTKDAFKESNIDSITLCTTVIPRECFEGCKNLKYVNANNVEVIEEGAFYGCTSLKTINFKNVTYLGGSVFKKTSISHLTIPASINTIECDAFSGEKLRTIEFLGKYPPVIKDGKTRVAGYNKRIIVPKGSFDKYNKEEWSNFVIQEKDGGIKLDLNITEAGTLNQFITDENCLRIAELKISGNLYDTDLKAIGKCKNLKVLDLERSFILTSPETIKKKKDESNASMALLALTFNLAANEAEMKYNVGKGNAVDVVLSKTLAEAFDQASNAMDADDGTELKLNAECISPNFNVPSYLEKYTYPRLLKNIDQIYDEYWYGLKEVVFPPHVMRITEAFRGNQLEKVNIPKSVEWLSCIIGASNLEVIDISNTNIKVLAGAFGKCENIKIFKGNKTLKVCNNKFGRDYQVIGYFYTEEKPEEFNEKYFKEIHIPQGTKEGWKLADPRVRIIDDIVL